MKFLFILVLILYLVHSDDVCDERVFMSELRQDLEDNGRLDCSRNIQEPISINETPSERNRRILAVWNTNCAFEADYNWMDDLKKYHEIHTLVDPAGVPVDEDFADQADMCEIVRAAVYAEKFPGITIQHVDKKILDFIDCPGEEGQTEICAANSFSTFQKDKWFIFLFYNGMKFLDWSFQTTLDRKPTMDDTKEDQQILQHKFITGRYEHNLSDEDYQGKRSDSENESSSLEDDSHVLENHAIKHKKKQSNHKQTSNDNSDEDYELADN